MTTILDVPSLAAQGRSFQPRLSLPDWMEQQIVLPANFGRPGPLHLDPWQRDIASRVGDPAIHHMSLQLPSQTFKSLFISGVVMYAAVHDIPAILAFPSGKLKDRWVRTKLERFARSCPIFEAAIVRTNQDTIPDDGIYLRSGGMIPFATGGGQGQMQQVEANLILIDELDAFVDDPTDLLEARGTSMPWYHVIACSTPTIEGDSLIEYRYDLSDRGNIHVLCPVCGHGTPLEYQHDHPEAVWCQSCGVAWGDEDQEGILAGAHWQAQVPVVADHPGYQTSLLVNGVNAWSDTLGKRHTMKPEGFTTQVLAECFTSDVETPPEASALEHTFRSVDDWAKLGPPVRMMVVDVQRRQGGSLVVCRLDVYGSEIEPKIAIRWQREVYKADREWMALFGDLRKLYVADRPDLMFVDCGDYSGANVIDFVEQLFPWETDRGIVRHIRGDGQRHSRYWGTDPAVKGGVTIDDVTQLHKTLVLNVNTTKSRLMFLLHTDQVALPSDKEHYPRNILEQLTSEKLIHKDVRGEPRQQWVKVSRGRENETWDCCNYGLAGAEYLGENFRAYQNALVSKDRTEALWGQPGRQSEDDKPVPGPKRNRRAQRYIEG